MIVNEDLNMAIPDTPTVFGSFHGNTIEFPIYNLTEEAQSLPEKSSDHNQVMFHAEDLGYSMKKDGKGVTNWKKFNRLLGCPVGLWR